MTFWMPNTYQLFRGFEPALGVPDDERKRRLGTARRPRGGGVGGDVFALRVGIVGVSPFLYFQF